MNDIISFPGLGISFNPPRVAFEIFGRGIYWYGIILALAFLTAALYAINRAPKFGITGDDFTDILFFATPAAIICARAYFVIFQWKLYADNPISALYVWDGGVAIYGAVIGAVLTALIVTTVKKINLAAVLDIGSLGLLIGQAIGRWGNFINREAYGTVTNLPWRMEILNRVAGVRQAVHPTFLYESLWNVLGFILLHNFSKKRKYNGQVFLMYLAWYGFGRGLIEGLRTDSLYLTDTLRVSQLLGYGSCILALLLLFYNFIFKSHDPSKLVDLTEASAETPEDSVPAEETPEKAESPAAPAEAPETDRNPETDGEPEPAGTPETAGESGPSAPAEPPENPNPPENPEDAKPEKPADGEPGPR